MFKVFERNMISGFGRKTAKNGLFAPVRLGCTFCIKDRFFLLFKDKEKKLYLNAITANLSLATFVFLYHE